MEQIRKCRSNVCAVLQTVPERRIYIDELKSKFDLRNFERHTSAKGPRTPLLHKAHVEKLCNDGFVVIPDFVDEIFIHELLVLKYFSYTVEFTVHRTSKHCRRTCVDFDLPATSVPEG